MGTIGSNRVVIADDHPPTRAALHSALVSGGFEVVGEAFDARGAVTLVRSTTPDVALLDVRMPGGGIAAAAMITHEGAGTSVVMLTVSDEDEDVFAALRVGARGYLLKGGDLAELPSQLRKILTGEAVLEGHVLHRVVEEFQERERRRLFSDEPRVQLSGREREVLARLEQGATTAEIAKELFVAQVTVRSHIAAICRKLKLPDRHAAVRELRSQRVPPIAATDDIPIAESERDDPRLGERDS